MMKLPEPAARAEVWMQRDAINAETGRKLTSLAQPLSVSARPPAANAQPTLVLDHQEQWLVMRVADVRTESSSQRMK